MPGVPSLPDVVGQFQSLKRRGERLGVVDGFGREFRDRRYSTFHREGGMHNHFQGIQRLGRYLLVTGSYPHPAKRGDLLVFELGSRHDTPGAWGSNMLREPAPPAADKLVAYFELDKVYWHPGGFSLLDQTAFIPMEGSAGTSKIMLVDVSTPASPAFLSKAIIRRPHWKAGACAATRMPDGTVLLAVWSDSDKSPKRAPPARYHLDLYRSETQDVTSQYSLVAQYHPAPDGDFHHKWQTMDFLWEEHPTGRRLFLVGFENSAENQPNPLDPGINRAVLFEVNRGVIPREAPAGGPRELSETVLSYVDEVNLGTNGNWCNLDAGACAYVDSDQQLLVYGVYHFLARLGGHAATDRLAFKALEYRATEFGPITHVEDAWVDLHEEAGLQGRHLALNHWNWAVEHLGHLLADGEPLRAVRSLEYQLPPDQAFVLYPGAEFRGHPPLALIGDGSRKGLDVLGTDFAGLVGSCRLEPASAARALPEVILDE